jgi:hypothetical protein
LLHAPGCGSCVRTEVAYIAILLGQSFSAYRRHVIEHDGQILIDQRPQQIREHLLDFVLVFDDGVHRTKQVLMFNRLDQDAGQGDGFQPAQHAQFRIRLVSFGLRGEHVHAVPGVRRTTDLAVAPD